MKIAELMTTDVVSATADTSLKEVAELLVAHRISGVPVVDADRRVLGVVSEADIVRGEKGETHGHSLAARILATRREDEPPARTAGEAMAAPAITVSPDATVARAARLIDERRVNRLPVVDEEGRLLGIVTRADLVRAFVRSDEEIAAELRDEVVARTLWIDPEPIEISVDAGEVTLAGEVDTRADARLLELFASRVAGVVAVRSELRWRIDEPHVPAPDPRVTQPPSRW